MRGRTGVPRGYALETVHEVLESGVQAVDAVDGVHGRVPAFQRRAESFEDGGVGPGVYACLRVAGGEALPRRGSRERTCGACG